MGFSCSLSSLLLGLQRAARWAAFALGIALAGTVTLGFLARPASAQSPLASVCQSNPASIQAMLEDPLLAEFFELTCGPQALKAAQAAKTAPAADAANNPVAYRQGVARPKAARLPDLDPANQNQSGGLPGLPAGSGDASSASKPALDPKLIDQPAPELDSPEPSAAAQVVFSKFRFEGQIEISQDHLARAVAPLMGQPITRERLVYLTQALAKTYRDLGWLVTVHLPNQDVSSGKVTVQIKEARFTGLEIVDPQGVLKNTTLVRDMVQDAQPIGSPVNLENAKEAQNRLNEIPGVVAQLNLKKGVAEGETTGVVQVAEDKPVRLDVSVDNSGARATGNERLAAGLVVNNPLRRGDQFAAQLLTSEGLNYGSLSYSVPVTRRAWRLGARVTSMKYSLITDDFAGSVAKGPSQSASVFLQLPFSRSLRHRVRFDANYSTNRYRHELDSETYSRYTSDILAMGWSASAMNLLPGVNQTGFDLSVSRGRIDLSGSTDEHRDVDASGPQTAGYFSKAKIGLTHRQFITPKTSVFTSLRGQWADKNLDSSERFTLGGSGGVRAYPTGEASGSTGGIATLELQHREPIGPASLSLAGFYDHGEIRVYRDNDFEEPNTNNRYSLKGYGVWLGAELPMTNGGLLGLRLTWARRDGLNPAATEGLDQDGTLDKNRYWLDAYYRY